MIVGSNQPYLFPYIGYWQLMNLSDTYVISDSMQYIKKGYINRNSILLNGQAHRFSLEVKGVHEKTLINEVMVGNNKHKISSTMRHAYLKAPHFKEVFPLIEACVMNDEDNLAQYLSYSIKQIAQYLEIETEFLLLSELQGETTLKAQARTIDICKRVNASRYVNAIGGQALYDRESFQQENITLSFLQSDTKSYQQFKNEFVPNLSIVDVMMFNSKEHVQNMLTEYILV